jgi:hypothetical protein
VLYSRATVTYRGAGKSRRWRSAIAIVAALCLFAAVITGWASRGSALIEVALPQPAALSQGAHAHVSEHSASQLSHPDTPVHQKFNAWMTRERPPERQRVTPESVWSLVPTSLVAWGVPPGNTHSIAYPAALADRDLLTLICVARL